MAQEKSLSLDEKRELARRLLKAKSATQSAPKEEQNVSYDDFLQGTDRQLSEVREFSRWLDKSGFRQSAPKGAAGQSSSDILDFATYNYLGLGSHPEVIEEAQSAIEKYGLGAGASAVAGGELEIHRELKEALVNYYQQPDSAALLFSAGYNVNTATLSALMKPGTHIVLDSLVHMSLWEGARLSGATLHNFQHNDLADLTRVLKSLLKFKSRVLVCVESVYSADGDFGRLAEIADVSKRHGALLLVDEAHSALLCGPQGRGVAAREKVLDKVDLLVLTFSKGFGGVGGCLIAEQAVVDYLTWYARSHVFSCALSPGVTGGVLKALKLAASEYGEKSRNALSQNAQLLRNFLKGKVDLAASESWIVPVVFGPESLSVKLSEYLSEHGLMVSLMQYPAVPKGAARMRLFVNAQHTGDQLEEAARIVLQAAEKFGFRL